jgi:hypothetical protein
MSPSSYLTRWSRKAPNPARLVSLNLHPSARRNTARALLLPLELVTKLELDSLDLVAPERQGDELITVVPGRE